MGTIDFSSFGTPLGPPFGTLLEHLFGHGSHSEAHSTPKEALEWESQTGTILSTPSGGPGERAAPVEEAVLEMCARGLFAIYMYTSAAPCISMHVVILTLMLQQSQMQWDTETPSLIVDLEFEICSRSAGCGKPMQSEHNGCIYAACCYLLLAQMHQSKVL